ncbi:hypothetical protein NZOSNM25_002039 [Nitrosopumilus zosterae]|nr:hypothetical protein [Nitrosopumilus zosterae]BDQ31897.1 hypothetical protein NZOSNM25_002039 [Nitrosopumilus zosterae]
MSDGINVSDRVTVPIFCVTMKSEMDNVSVRTTFFGKNSIVWYPTVNVPVPSPLITRIVFASSSCKVD